MSNKKFNEFKSLFIPSDIMPISMILIGIIISLFISEIAIKLIGVSISILGVVVLLMKLTTRMSSSVETKFKSNPPPNFKITVKKSPEAVRQVIENYSGDIEEKENKAENEKNGNSAVTKKPLKNTMGDEEGFRIVKKEIETDSEPIKKEELKTKTENPTEKEISSEIVEPVRKIVPSKPNQDNNFKSPHRFRKREINIPTQGLLEEMPILKEHPDKEFEFFINRILMAIRSVSNTRTAAYFFYNEHKNEIILNSFATESKTVINRKSKFIAGNDIVSQIARSMKPEILTDINPAAELDLLPYYSSNSGTNSFIGIPVIYDKNVIGVLTADSKHSDAYDAIMVNFLSHFAKLISGLIRSYSDKYDLAQDSKYLKAYKKLEQLVGSSDNNVYNELVSSIEGLFSTRNVYSIVLDDSKTNYIIKTIAKPENADFEKDFVFNNDNSILSECISTNDFIYLDKPDTDLIRVNVGEDMSSGYFYVIPLSTDIDTYGAVAIEGKEGSNLDRNERTFIKSLVNKASNIIENNHLLELIKSGFDKDPQSGLLTEKSINSEIEKEISRVSNFSYSSSLVSIGFDKYKSIDDQDERINESILKHINSSLDSTLDTLDLKGILDNNLIVLLPGKNAQSAKLWAERIRNKIASESLYLADKRYNITVSVGICELETNSSVKSIVKNVNDALEVSKEKTNTVSVYS
jgi:diguanylate cyclase (GGDEF)-like protein